MGGYSPDTRWEDLFSKYTGCPNLLVPDIGCAGRTVDFVFSLGWQTLTTCMHQAQSSEDTFDCAFTFLRTALVMVRQKVELSEMLDCRTTMKDLETFPAIQSRWNTHLPTYPQEVERCFVHIDYQPRTQNASNASHLPWVVLKWSSHRFRTALCIKLIYIWYVFHVYNYLYICYMLRAPCHILGSWGAVRFHDSFACRMKASSLRTDRWQLTTSWVILWELNSWPQLLFPMIPVCPCLNSVWSLTCTGMTFL